MPRTATCSAVPPSSAGTAWRAGMPASRSARCSTDAIERAMGGGLSRIDQDSTRSVTNVTQRTARGGRWHAGPASERLARVSVAQPIADDRPERPEGDVARALAWTAFVVLPMAGLVMLLAAPATDVHWEH